MLDEIINSGNLRAKAVVGFWPANRSGANDISVWHEHGEDQPAATLHFLRQQTVKAEEETQLCLADFVAPESSGKQDYLGGFVVTAGIGAEELARKYEAEQNDYNALMVKALADRLAEAFAEHMHEKFGKNSGVISLKRPLAMKSSSRKPTRVSGQRPAIRHALITPKKKSYLNC